MKKLTEKNIRGLKATAVAIKLPIEGIDYEALNNAIQRLEPTDLGVLMYCFGFIGDGTPNSIPETTQILNIQNIQFTIKHLKNALAALDKQKESFYTPHSNVSTSDEISEMWDLNLRAYHCLQKADKHSLEDLENMTLQELLDLPGIKSEDFSNILISIEKYRRAKGIFQNTLETLDEF